MERGRLVFVLSMMLSLFLFAACGGGGGGGNGEVPITGVSLNKTSTSIRVSHTEQLTATITPADATNKVVTWTSSDESKATVSGTGLVTAVGEGSVTITVATENGDSTASCEVTGYRLWGTAALIEADDAGDALFPHIAFDANGNAIAVWRQSDGTRNNIWANRYTAGSGWDTATLIEDNDGNADQPQIAIDASGNAIAVWCQKDGTRNDIWANRYTVGSGWDSTAARIETDNAGPADQPQIAFDTSGNAIAVWRQSDGTRSNIWANRYAAGSGWGTAALIEADNTGHANEPQIAIDANGNPIAVWCQSDGTQYNIWANRYTAGSVWDTAALIENNAGNANNPQIAIDANGNAIAMWRQSDGTRNNIWANRYTAGSGWDTAALIEDDAGNADQPQIAIDASGNAIAVWRQSDGTRNNIWANRYTAGSAWGTAALIETDNAGDALYPQIAIDASGNAIAVWCQNDGTQYNIWANRYTAGSVWGTAALIETDNAGDADQPQIAIDASGNAIAVWCQSDGTQYNIWANPYD